MAIAERALLERVKAAALANGVRIEPPVLARLGGPSALTIHEYATTGGVTLVLPDDVYVNAPFDEPFCRASELVLAEEDGAFALRHPDGSVEVRSVLPLPGYLAARDGAGRAVSDTVMSHADRIRVSPIVGCAYDCHFCDLGTLRYERRPFEQLLAALDVALDDVALPPRHALVSGGSPGSSAGHQQYFEEACAAIVAHLRDEPLRRGREPLDVDIMMSAVPDGPAFVERMVERGVTGFSFNIEVFSPTAASRHLPRKHERSRPHLETCIDRAVGLLGRGTGRVRSLIIVGLETPEETLAGVEWLASLGCEPVLSPFRPARGTALAEHAPPSNAMLMEVLAAAREIAAAHGVALGPRCLPCQHNTLTFPWDVTTAVAA